MISRGLLVRIEAKSGKEADVEALLRSALPLVQSEPGTGRRPEVRGVDHRAREGDGLRALR